MEAAEHAARGAAVIVLDEMLHDPGLGKGPGAPGLGEETALVLENARFDQLDFGKGGVDDLHPPRPPFITPSR